MTSVIDRRAFIGTLVGGLLAAPLGGEAQQARVYKVGFLGATAGPASGTEAFRQGLRERGWVEGQNITLEYRWGWGKSDEVLADRHGAPRPVHEIHQADTPGPGPAEPPCLLALGPLPAVE